MLNPDFLPIQGERVRLRPLQTRDAQMFAEGTADPNVQRYGHLPEPEYTPESVRTMIERDVVPGLERGDLAVLAIADSATDAFAGSLVIFDVSDESAEVGFWVHPDYRGAGIASAALALAAGFAWVSGLRELAARTLPENSASQRTLTAAGFAFKHQTVDTAPSGERVELLHYLRRCQEGDEQPTPDSLVDRE